jgi:hypothetical protein
MNALLTKLDTTARCPALLLPLLAVLGMAVTTPKASACDVEVGPGATLKLSGDFIFDCVIVHAGGQLNLKQGSITITDPGGLTCDGTINIGTGGAGELILAGSSPLAPPSSVNGTLKILPNGTLRLEGDQLSVPGTLTVNGDAAIGGGLTITGTTSSVNGTMTIALNGGLIVKDGATLPVSGALAVDTALTITGDGSTLILTNGGMLSLEGQATVAGGLNQSAPARLVLANGGSTLLNGTIRLANCTAAIEIAGGDHSLTGAGTILGECNSVTDPLETARIVLTDPVKLTSAVTIAGALQIQAKSGTFVNEGLVNADGRFSDKTVTLHGGTFGGDGEWKVSGLGATLHFGALVTVNPLGGDFTVSAGTLDIDESVCTTGDLTFTGGTIDVNASESFTAGGSCP